MALKNILVTGGTGYIGSHTVVELLGSGYNVHIIDNLSNSDRSMLERIHQITNKIPYFTQLDLRNKIDVFKFFEKHTKFDGIIHFAALKSVGESVFQPLKYYENNVVGLLNLLEGSSQNNINNFVFSSSCTVYGSPDLVPVTEHTKFGHTPSPYGATKQMCERILDDYSYSSSDYNTISLRYFNPLGAHDSGIIGELPSGIPNNLMPYITQTAIGIRPYLAVFGNDYSTPDGTAIRDYIHVMDLAKAHVKAVEYFALQTGKVNEKINIGTGKGKSVFDIIHSFEKVSGIKLNYKIEGRREGDVESIYANATKAENLLNWKAELSLDDMTRSAWNWEQKYRKEG
ncbi:MAG: UDP-glucose 4-epimerase GalE [Saprospiraceae bacterium]|nr:UDP-glucose 4-epimerase GalE [Saprospiraceae bacterium]